MPTLLLRLPYRVQIPLGLSLAVLVAALLVTGVSARFFAQSARQETLATVDHAALLLAGQARPLLAADDTWRMYALLRSVASFLPGAAQSQARVAVLDAEGRVFASSEPARLPTSHALHDAALRGQSLPPLAAVQLRVSVETTGGGQAVIEPIRSEDGQVLGYTFIEIDGPVFATNWVALARPALIGVGLAIVSLVPVGWWLGRRIASPVARIARIIERVGHDEAGDLRQRLPRTTDPEISRIASAVDRLIAEMQIRDQAQQRALSAERLAAVGRLTAAVAHEINNPLAGLLTATQTLDRHGDSPEARRRTVELLQRGLEQIRATVAALLPQARLEDRALEPDDIDDVITLVHPTADRHGVQLHTHVNVVSALRVPAAVMRQVMLNLLLNACKAAGDTGRVDVALHADQDEVRFIVTHAGRVLTREALEEVIDAESGNDPRGFGLWVCREIANRYAGGFHVDPSVSAGTRLVFWMPNRT